jgi:anti-sigma-K factor RskA
MTTSDTDLPDDAALAAEYALGLLSADDARAFEARMATDPDLRALHARWATDFASLTDSIPEVAPPPSVAAALDATLFAEPRQSLWQRLGLLPALLGGLVAALLVLWATSQGLLQPEPVTGPRLAAEIAAPDLSFLITASFDPRDSTLRLDRMTGEARAGRVLELWLIAGNDAPVSLGVLPPESTAFVTISADLAARLPAATLAISDEPPGGSTTGAPTGDVLALGAVTTL